MKRSAMLVLSSMFTGEAKEACDCKNTWSYPTHYSGGMCVGPIIGCPSTPCDDDSQGPWCVVTDKNCSGATGVWEGGRKYYYAYCSPASPRGPKLAPDSSSIRYIGRFDMANPKAPRFAWSMTGLTATFQGSQAVYGMFSFPKVGGRLRVVVDGETVGFVQQSGASSLKQFLLADDLNSSTSHVLEVYKVTEKGDMTFGGFQLASGSFERAPKAPARRIEFIGDSDIAGWCADGSPLTGRKDAAFEDAYVAWAQQIARSLGAEPMVEAVTGWGVTNLTVPIQNVLDYSIRFEPKVSWDYSKWTPDAVVIMIGANDFPMKKIQERDFIKQYKGLMDMVATNYKNAETPPTLIHVCGGCINGLEPCDDIQIANEQFNAEQEQKKSGFKGFFTSITREHWNMINAPWGMGISAYNGCAGIYDGHYNEKGHRVVARDILPQIQKIMGWDPLVWM